MIEITLIIIIIITLFAITIIKKKSQIKSNQEPAYAMSDDITKEIKKINGRLTDLENKLHTHITGTNKFDYNKLFNKELTQTKYIMNFYMKKQTNYESLHDQIKPLFQNKYRQNLEEPLKNRKDLKEMGINAGMEKNSCVRNRINSIENFRESIH